MLSVSLFSIFEMSLFLKMSRVTLLASLFGDDEVELLLLDVGLGHFDANGVSKLIGVVMASAYETVVFFVEIVVVVIKVMERHHALTVVLVNLAVDSVALDAADVGVEDLSQLVGHELHHLIFYGVALGVLGNLLHLAAVLTEFLIVVLVGRAAALLIAG